MSPVTTVRAGLTFAAILAIAVVAVWFARRGAEHELKDIEGVAYGSIEHPRLGPWSILFFLTPDCPIANQYAPEIRRICDASNRRVRTVSSVYADRSLTADSVRKHSREFHGSHYPAILDSDYSLVAAAGATVSSETAVFSSGGKLEYRGRIDDFNAALGTPRQHATQHDLRDTLDALSRGTQRPEPTNRNHWMLSSDNKRRSPAMNLRVALIIATLLPLTFAGFPAGSPTPAQGSLNFSEHIAPIVVQSVRDVSSAW